MENGAYSNGAYTNGAYSDGAHSNDAFTNGAFPHQHQGEMSTSLPFHPNNMAQTEGINNVWTPARQQINSPTGTTNMDDVVYSNGAYTNGAYSDDAHIIGAYSNGAHSNGAYTNVVFPNQHQGDMSTSLPVHPSNMAQTGDINNVRTQAREQSNSLTHQGEMSTSLPVQPCNMAQTGGINNVRTQAREQSNLLTLTPEEIQAMAITGHMALNSVLPECLRAEPNNLGLYMMIILQGAGSYLKLQTLAYKYGIADTSPVYKEAIDYLQSLKDNSWIGSRLFDDDTVEDMFKAAAERKVRALQPNSNNAILNQRPALLQTPHQRHPLLYTPHQRHPSYGFLPPSSPPPPYGARLGYAHPPLLHPPLLPPPLYEPPARPTPHPRNGPRSGRPGRPCHVRTNPTVSTNYAGGVTAGVQSHPMSILPSQNASGSKLNASISKLNASLSKLNTSDSKSNASGSILPTPSGPVVPTSSMPNLEGPFIPTTSKYFNFVPNPSRPFLPTSSNSFLPNSSRPSSSLQSTFPLSLIPTSSDSFTRISPSPLIRNRSPFDPSPSNSPAVFPVFERVPAPIGPQSFHNFKQPAQGEEVTSSTSPFEPQVVWKS